VYGEDITKGSPVVVKLAFNPTKLADPSTLPTGTGLAVLLTRQGRI